MLRKTVVALALSAGVILSGSALAEPAKFDEVRAEVGDGVRG